MKEKAIFLTAQWEYLVMLNYPVPPEILIPYLPKGTELDLFQGKALVSVVGFLFNNTKVFGIRWPFHTNFEEVNLRFYVKRFNGKEWKRGVAFISEIVPKHMIAWMANTLYNEHYSRMPMKHQAHLENDFVQLNYEWQNKLQWNSLKVKALNRPSPIEAYSAEEFIFEHYWGYNQLNKNTLIEYGVEHPSWEVYPVTYYELNADIARLYGTEFVPYLLKEPHSIMLAKGSSVTIRKPSFVTV
ncbi:MAG TPA: DUF2071 domain-containing protein [Sediminibacterium sp.]|jgi:uncharacterized protein YqjF (DUF2071 family)|nr:DUF2071 domain-containing protein [Sediminibacterium sp.]